MEQLCQGFAKIVEEFQELHGLRFPTNGEKRRKVYLKDIIAATIKAFKANDEEWQKMIPAWSGEQAEKKPPTQQCGAVSAF